MNRSSSVPNPPPAEFTEIVPMSGPVGNAPVEVTIRTRKLDGAPYFLYLCYVGDQLILNNTISRPGIYELQDAIAKARASHVIPTGSEPARHHRVGEPVPSLY